MKWLKRLVIQYVQTITWLKFNQLSVTRVKKIKFFERLGKAKEANPVLYYNFDND